MSTSKKSEDETKVAGNTASTTHRSVATDVDGITQARNLKRYHALQSFEKAFRSKEDSSMIKTPASRTLIAAISGTSQSISAKVNQIFLPRTMSPCPQQCEKLWITSMTYF